MAVRSSADVFLKATAHSKKSVVASLFLFYRLQDFLWMIGRKKYLPHQLPVHVHPMGSSASHPLSRGQLMGFRELYQATWKGLAVPMDTQMDKMVFSQGTPMLILEDIHCPTAKDRAERS